jgi:ribose 5-phosphate isomerase B
MTIYLGADHRGFAMKEILKAMLTGDGYDVVDCGAAALDPSDDYPDYAKAVAEAVGKNSGVGDESDGDRGIVVCGSGIGIDIAANKFPGIRCALPAAPDQIYAARHDDNVNVLALAADFTDGETAKKIVKTFLSTPFEKEERYRRRIKKIADFEAPQG